MLNWFGSERVGPDLGNRPRVHLYTMSWNERRMLPFFFRHYDSWVERYVVFDDHSTDGTLDILRIHPRVEIRPLVRAVPESFVLSAQNIHNTCWKESRGIADWVIITAIDEHLYLPDFGNYLIRCRKQGITAVPALGFDMMSESFPQGEQRLCDLVRMGEPAVAMSKLSLFDPNRITDTNYAVGRHTAEPRGRVCYPEEDRLLNLHFKNLGSDYVISRSRLLASGLGKTDRIHRWGAQYDRSDATIAVAVAKRYSRAFDVFAAGPLAIEKHTAPRWWRKRKGLFRRLRSLW